MRGECLGKKKKKMTGKSGGQKKIWQESDRGQKDDRRERERGKKRWQKIKKKRQKDDWREREGGKKMTKDAYMYIKDLMGFNINFRT